MGASARAPKAAELVAKLAAPARSHRRVIFMLLEVSMLGAEVYILGRT
jgi:hypothetical protein